MFTDLSHICLWPSKKSECDLKILVTLFCSKNYFATSYPKTLPQPLGFNLKPYYKSSSGSFHNNSHRDPETGISPILSNILIFFTN